MNDVLDEGRELHLLNHIHGAVHVRAVAAEAYIDAKLEHGLDGCYSVADIGIARRIRDDAAACLGYPLDFVPLKMNAMNENPVVHQGTQLEQIVHVTPASDLGELLD